MSETVSTQKGFLTDVVIIRPVLVVLLVFYHAFAIYSGGWKPLSGYPEIKVYWWLDKLSYAFMLEMFVLISGYVFGYQVRVKGVEKLQSKTLFFNKIKRLMLPSVVFSILYFVLFRDAHNQPVWEICYEIIAGVGHMWFLPMLFLCFVGIWVVERIQINPKILFPVLLLLSISPLPLLPFNLRQAFYYFVFFYLGYYIQRNDIDWYRHCNKRSTLFLLVLFIVLFFLLTWLNDNITHFIKMDDDNLLLKMLVVIINKASKIIYSLTGIAMVFCFIWANNNSNNQRNNIPKKWLIDLGGLCMGVYLFQQFIIVALYNYTSLPSLAGPYILPWLGFIIALLGSLFLSWLFNKTKIGRILIG